MMGAALAFDSDGWPIRRSVSSSPREDGKTAILAALSLNRLLTSAGRPEILLAAPSEASCPLEDRVPERKVFQGSLRHPPIGR
jgi:hypothetical protein